jgi:hypothetical protein
MSRAKPSRLHTTAIKVEIVLISICNNISTKQQTFFYKKALRTELYPKGNTAIIDDGYFL